MLVIYMYLTGSYLKLNIAAWQHFTTIAAKLKISIFVTYQINFKIINRITEAPFDVSSFYESRETRETNSSVIRPLDLVLMTKCSGYFLSNMSKPYQGFPLDSTPGQSSDVRYLLTRLWCQTLAYLSTSWPRIER